MLPKRSKYTEECLGYYYLSYLSYNVSILNLPKNWRINFSLLHMFRKDLVSLALYPWYIFSKIFFWLLKKNIIHDGSLYTRCLRYYYLLFFIIYLFPIYQSVHSGGASEEERLHRRLSQDQDQQGRGFHQGGGRGAGWELFFLDASLLAFFLNVTNIC